MKRLLRTRGDDPTVLAGTLVEFKSAPHTRR